MCVSTAIVGSPKTVFRITLAVFLPTPGNSSSDALSFGTFPSCLLINTLHVLMIFFALLLYKPIVFIYFLRFFRPKDEISLGVFATA